MKIHFQNFERFYIYQKERFPILGHGLLVASFSFSAIAYSRICRGATDFVDWRVYGVGIFTTITLFLLVRIFDEHKDAEDDAMYRKELPVPRGLVSLTELRNIGIAVAILQVLVNLYFFPKMLLIYAVIIAYLSLMGKEFFIADWLKKTSILVRHFPYVYYPINRYLRKWIRLALRRCGCAKKVYYSFLRCLI